MNGRWKWTTWPKEWGRDQLEPWMEIQFKNGEIMLVGHVNEKGGTCGCCDIEARDIKMYRMHVCEED